MATKYIVTVHGHATRTDRQIHGRVFKNYDEAESYYHKDRVGGPTAMRIELRSWDLASNEITPLHERMRVS